jgi:hypothetical protein
MSITANLQFWRDRAEEARSIAELMSNPQTKRRILSVAEGYSRLVESAREPQSSGPKILAMQGSGSLASAEEPVSADNGGGRHVADWRGSV